MGSSFDQSLLKDTQLGSGPGESGLCCSGLLHNTHRALSVNNDGGVIWVLSCDMEKSPGQLEILISPLSFGLAVMVPTQSGFRGRDSLLSVLTLIHAAQLTSTSAHTHFHLERKHKSFICTSTEILLYIISPVKRSAAPPVIGCYFLFHISVSWMQSDSSVRQRKLPSAALLLLSVH